MTDQLGKELYKAQQRILDHRVFVNGEIESFLHNFEVKRNEAEVETLFRVTEVVGSLKYELSNPSILLGSQNIKNISVEINKLLSGVEYFLTIAQQERKSSEELIRARQDREERKQIFLQNLQHSYQRLENSFVEKEEEIAELYSDLQLKLNILK